MQQNGKKASRAQKPEVQQKPKLAIDDANTSMMLNDAINFNTANSTNMFTEKFYPHKQVATFEALNFNAQENGCLSFLDTLITYDANNSLNFSAFKNQSIFDNPMMVEGGPSPFAEPEQMNFDGPDPPVFDGGDNKAVKEAIKYTDQQISLLMQQLITVMRTNQVSTIHQTVEAETEVKEKKKQVTKNFMKALILA